MKIVFLDGKPSPREGGEGRNLDLNLHVAGVDKIPDLPGIIRQIHAQQYCFNETQKISSQKELDGGGCFLNV